MKVTQYLKKNGEKRSSDRVIFHVYGGRHLGFGSCVTGVNKHHRAFVNTFLRTVYGSGTAVYQYQIWMLIWPEGCRGRRYQRQRTCQEGP